MKAEVCVNSDSSQEYLKHFYKGQEGQIRKTIQDLKETRKQNYVQFTI